MAQSIIAMNEQINKQLTSVKRTLLSKQSYYEVTLVLVFSLMTFSLNYRLGAVFMLPILCFLVQFNKKLALFTMIMVSGLSLLIQFYDFISVIVAFIPLYILIHRDNKKDLNLIILILVSLMSYCMNVVLGITTISALDGLFIIAFNFIFYQIYVQAIQLNDYQLQKRHFLFKEELLAILTLFVNLLIPLLSAQFRIVNLGIIAIVFIIMALGIVTNRTYTLSFSLIMYLIIEFSPVEIEGIEVIPFIGLLSAFLPSNNPYLKSFLYYLLVPVLYFFGYFQSNVLNVLIEVGISTTLFYGTSFIIYNRWHHRLIPKYEESKYYQIYVENFREDISQRLLNFAELFSAFANKSVETNNELLKMDDAIDEMIEKHCKSCLKKELCLNSNHIKTYNYFTQLLKEGDRILHNDKKRFLDLFRMFCLNAYDVINSSIELNQEYALSSKKQTSGDGAFQSQLEGLSQILQDFAIEVNTDFENETIKIEKFRERVLKLGVNLSYLKVNSIKKRNLDIDLGLRDYKEGDLDHIETSLEEVAKEEIEMVTVKKTKGMMKLKLISKQKFELEFGSSYIGKDGSRISGDNFLKCDMHNGNTVIALSDGMGSGYSAHVESKSTLELLNKMLQTGVDDHTAVSIINTLISLKEYNERFSTLDYVTINRSLGTIDFYKIGSAPSFIIRGNKVIRINNDNLPMGVSKDVDKISFNIEENDIILIVSDGVVERFNQVNKFEQVVIQLLKASTIQLAHDIIRAAITEFGGKIVDDMTAIVIKVNKCSLQLTA